MNALAAIPGAPGESGNWVKFISSAYEMSAVMGKWIDFVFAHIFQDSLLYEHRLLLL